MERDTQPSLLRLDFSLNSDVTDRAAITVSNGESRQRNFFQLSGFCMTKDHPVVRTMCFHRLKKLGEQCFTKVDGGSLPRKAFIAIAHQCGMGCVLLEVASLEIEDANAIDGMSEDLPIAG